MPSYDPNMMTTHIRMAFEEEIARVGGQVRDVYDDGDRMFLRSVLPEVQAARINDHLQGGVALRSGGADVWVHPYLFRQVCSNGAIRAQSIESHHVGRLRERTPDDVLPELREAIAACAAPGAFHSGVRQMRGALEMTFDAELSMLAMMNHFPNRMVVGVLREYFRANDKSIFGLVNAVTAAARQAADPQVRWDLEELGGGMLSRIEPPAPHLDDRAEQLDEAEAEESLAS